MEHAEIRRRLSAYLDNAVGVEEKEEIKRHLGRCGNCRGALADLELAIGRLRSLPEIEPPPWLTGKIMAKVQAAAAPKPGVWQRLLFPLPVKLPLGVAALVLLCAIGYYLVRTTGPELPLPATAPVKREQPPRPAIAPTAPQGSPLPAAPPASPSPARPAASGATPQLEAPPPAQLSPSAPAPSLPAKHAPPELQSADEESGEQREALPSHSREEKFSPRRPQKKAAADEARPAWEAGVTLLVADPAAAVGAIEQAVTRHGGRISGHAYGAESHLLVVRIAAQRLPGFLDRLGQIGTVQERPQVSAEGGEMVDLVIKW